MKRLNLALTVLFIFTPALAFAHDGPQTRAYLKACRQWRAALTRIDLSPAQKPKVANLLEDYKEEIAPFSDELPQARKDLFKSIFGTSDELETQTVRDSHQIVAALKEEILVELFELMGELQDVLTRVQYKLLVKSQAKLHQCSMAPKVIFRRTINDWIEKHIAKDKSPKQNKPVFDKPRRPVDKNSGRGSRKSRRG